MTLACLVPVEDLIRDAQRAYDSLVWDNPRIPVKLDGCALSEALSGLLNELDYLYSLREQGILWEPNF